MRTNKRKRERGRRSEKKGGNRIEETREERQKNEMREEKE